MIDKSGLHVSLWRSISMQWSYKFAISHIYLGKRKASFTFMIELFFKCVVLHMSRSRNRGPWMCTFWYSSGVSQLQARNSLTIEYLEYWLNDAVDGKLPMWFDIYLYRAIELHSWVYLLSAMFRTVYLISYNVSVRFDHWRRLARY